jgi:hypothetical protein
MSKGSKRRPAAVPRETVDAAWDRTFGPSLAADDAAWDAQFAAHPDALASMADHALADEREAWMQAEEDRALREALAARPTE